MDNFINQKINSVLAITFLLLLASVLGGVTWYYGNKGIEDAKELKLEINHHIDIEIKKADQGKK